MGHCMCGETCSTCLQDKIDDLERENEELRSKVRDLEEEIAEMNERE